MRAKAYRLNSEILNLPDDEVILCLPEFFRTALLAEAHRLLWDKVWGMELSEADRRRIEYGISQLSSEGCNLMDDCCNQIEGILDRLTELENMNINVNCGCGCGCSNQQQCPPNEAGEEDAELPPLPPSIPQFPTTQQAKCNAANFIATTLRNALVYLSQMGVGYPTFKAYWLDVWNVHPTPPTPPGLSAWMLAFSYVRFLDIPATWDSLHNNLVCLLYNAVSQNDALQKVNTFSEAFPDFTDAAIRLVAASVNYDILFNDLVALPPGYENRQCCGSVPDGPPLPPQAPEGYILVLAGSEDFTTTPNNATGSVSYNSLTGEFVLSPSSLENYHEVMVDVVAEDVVNRHGVEALHGMVVQYVSSSYLNENDGMTVSSNTGGALVRPVSIGEFCHYDNDEHANVTEFADYVDSFPNGTDYGNGPMTDEKASFQLQSYGTLPNSVSVRARVFYIAKVA